MSLYARYWPYAPDWATHLATDPDGLVYAFDREPSPMPYGTSYSEGWHPNGPQCQLVVVPALRWGDTLEARPCSR